MDRIIRKVIEKHNNLFEGKTNIEKTNAGFTNTIYIINNKYVLKICSNESNENAFKREIEFYNKNKENIIIPKLLCYDVTKEVVPYYFQIIEKIEGVSLYNVWHTILELERKNIIKQLCDAMKQSHKIKGNTYDWRDKIKSGFISYFQIGIDKNLFNAQEQYIINNSIKCFDKLLESNDFVLIHNDLHFDNILYNNGSIKLIDFERSMIAPRDFELDILYRMIRMPWKFASQETENFIKADDYTNIMGYIKEYYPKLLLVPNLHKRLAIYDMLYFVKQYIKHPEYEELKEPIMAGAKQLCDIIGKDSKIKTQNTGILKNITLYIPKVEDYWYEKKLQSDQDTMSYNAGYDVSYYGYHYDTGCIDFPENKWEEIYNKRINENRYFAYIKDKDLDEYVGYCNYQYNKNQNRYECGIVIESKYRGKGYSKQCLEMLCHVAKENGIKSLYDSFEIDRKNTLKVFESISFKIIEEQTWVKFGKIVKGVLVKKDL